MTGRRGSRFPFEHFEPAWQERWEAAGVFHADRDPARPKWFIVDLPPFANGKLHLGHVRNYSLADVDARFRRMAGYNVLYTTGFDSFGLPNESAAIEAGVHPALLAEQCIADMRRQFIRLGLGHDRRRIISYHEPAFYRWVQWVFLELLRAGLAFRRNAQVNWCPACDTALADSLVERGGCWRCGTAVESRMTMQWFVRERDHAEAMLAAMSELTDWPDLVKTIQTDWIGRRAGIEATFVAPGGISITGFLDDPGLLPSVGFVGVGIGHPAVAALRAAGRLGADATTALDELARSRLATREARKHGLAAGSGLRLDVTVRHPWNGAELPLLVLEHLDDADVLAGCPDRQRADQRIAHDLGISGEPAPGTHEPESLDRLVARGSVRPAVRYRLRDWNIARQRYWGTPIPVVHCAGCGAVPLGDADLPVTLPEDVELSASGNPLARHAGFLAVPCPSCAAPAQRDSDTLEAYSSPWWYHWHCRSLSGDDPFDPADTRYWMPVDVMIGGIDQSRTCFFHTRMLARVLRQMGHVLHDEPVRKLLAIGMVTRDGKKMSKSAGNQVETQALIEQYGADALRLGVLAAAAPTADMSWSEQGVRQAHGFLGSIWQFLDERRDVVDLAQVGDADATGIDALISSADPAARRTEALRRRFAGWILAAVRRVTTSYQRHDVHLAVKNARFLFERVEQFDREARRLGALVPGDRVALSFGVGVLLRLLAPLAPHMMEELWHALGGRGLLATARWPSPLTADDRTVEDLHGVADAS